MCGITGFFSKTSITKIEKRINRMNHSIIHRGPDAGNIYLENRYLALGHRRLSIIDTREISDQPMHSHSNKWHIVFNGEIYNFQEIKKQLTYRFITNSDTEVIIAAVEEKGVDWFLEQANGMFAIALFNSESQKLTLIRDRLGIKPLYYFNDGKTFVFASEIKAILHSGLVEAIFNENAVDEYLANRFVRSPYTFFKNILQLSPATYIEIDKEFSIKKTTYWSLPKEFNLLTVFDETNILNNFEKELKRSIQSRLISDVPLGTYLSGGVDSSIITAITSLKKKKKINTYTIGFKELNEFDYAKLVADKYNTNHHEILVKKEEYLNLWEELILYKDAPLGVPNEIPLAVMSCKLKEKITVVLSGEGADELLGGYGRIFRLPFDYQHSKKTNSFYEELISQYEYVPREMRDTLINTPKLYREEFDKKIKADFKNKSNEENVFRFFHQYHVKGLLQRVDMTTMQTSVEARVPFLDHKLIEFAYKEIPYDLKLKWRDKASKTAASKTVAKFYSEKLDTPKYILRKLSYKYLPKETIERKKVGFPVPLNDWLSNFDKMAKTLLKDVSWLQKGVIEKLLIDSKKEARAGQILWMFINIELFKKNYFTKSWKWN